MWQLINGSAGSLQGAPQSLTARSRPQHRRAPTLATPLAARQTQQQQEASCTPACSCGPSSGGAAGPRSAPWLAHAGSRRRRLHVTLLQKGLRRGSSPCNAASAALPASDPAGDSPAGIQAWHLVSCVTAGAMLLLNLHRSNFTMLVPLISDALSLVPSQVGLLHSAMLAGYLIGQLPGGFLADRYGGERVLLPSLLLWSCSLAAAAAAAAGPTLLPHIAAGTPPLLSLWHALLASRFIFGLCSATAMPAVSAMAASWVPRQWRASVLGAVYTLFNIGGVLGLWLTPLLAESVGGWDALRLVACLGVAWAAAGWAVVGWARGQEAGQAPEQQGQQQHLQQGQQREQQVLQQQQQQQQQGEDGGRGQVLLQVCVLCWCHAVIGWGFFVMASWLPLYLQSLGVESLVKTGALAALPYLATAAATATAGSAADRLARSGMPLLGVRTAMHAVSTLGCAAAVVPLALRSSPDPYWACGWLVLFQCCYGASFGGFHAYVQDVAAADAGLMLGITNSCSILMGIAGNLCTGALVGGTGSYRSVFAATAVLYVSSFVAFVAALRGRPLRLRRLHSA